MTNIIFGLSVLWISAVGCTQDFFDTETDNTPADILRHIWQDFSDNYALFEVKNVDWDSVLQAHLGELDAQSTTVQLYTHVTEMLRTLNDRHVTLYPASNPELPSWSVDFTPDGTYVQDDFDWDVIKDHYLENYREPSEAVQYGKLNEATGYIHIRHFDGSRRDYERGLDAALDELGGLESMIVDIRDNGGGYDPNAQYAAGRFAAEEALYMTSRKKNGPGPDDFAETREWYVAPGGGRQFRKPIIVLTTGSTASAAETFLLAMRTQTHIRQIGTTSAGNFADNPIWEAPNGWSYTISVGDFRAADGKSYEGIGLTPEIELASRPEDWVGGRDLVLEKALELLQ